jgi:hypothetical protein
MVGQNGQARKTDEAERSGPTAADLFDPIALEARLVEARARRAEALARRRLAKGDDGAVADGRHRDLRAVPLPPAETAPAQPARPETAPVPPARPEMAPARTAPASAAITASPPVNVQGGPREHGRRRLRGAPALAVALFLAGLVGGAFATVLAPPDLLERLTGGFGSTVETARSGPEAVADAPAEASGAPATAEPESAPDPAATPAQPSLAVADPEAAPATPDRADRASGSAAGADVRDAPELVPAAPPDAPLRPADVPRPTPLAEAPGLAAPESAAQPNVPQRADPRPELSHAAIAAPPDESAPPGTMLQLAARPEPAAPSAPEAAEEPNLLADARVLLNYPPSAASDAEAALDALRTAGAENAAGGEARVSVSRTNVRYFHSEDRATAEEVAAIIGRTSGTASDPRDFTGFSPRPPAGTLEVWLAGEAPPPVAARSQPAPSTPPRSAAPSEPPAAAADDPRARMQREVEILLRNRLESMRAN